MTLKEISKLTDYQISKIYFHKRDESGCIVFPEQPKKNKKTKRQEILEALGSLSQMKNMMNKDEYKIARKKLVDKLEALKTKKELNNG